MELTATIRRFESSYLAECVEMDAVGEGPDPDAALAALREALFERVVRPDAVAPPSRPDVRIHLTVVKPDAHLAEHSPSGPGEAPREGARLPDEAAR
jgi:hypothetical protein